MTDFRALCQELMDTIDSGIPVERIKQSPLAVRIDAALAQPEPRGHEAIARRSIESCLAQREEILVAFVAKYGFNPDEAVQVEQRQEDGTSTWKIERRPKPPSLKEQALAVLTQYMTGKTILTQDSVDTIRRALEALPDD